MVVFLFIGVFCIAVSNRSVRVNVPKVFARSLHAYCVCGGGGFFKFFYLFF